LENGNIKLEWCNTIVPNLSSFIESCGLTYSEEFLDAIYCNGYTIRHYIEIYQLENGLVSSTDSLPCISISENEYLEHQNNLFCVDLLNFDFYDTTQMNDNAFENNRENISIKEDFQFFNLQENTNECIPYEEYHSVFFIEGGYNLVEDHTSTNAY